MPDGIGDMNIGWGVCGFTSTFYAIALVQPAKVPSISGTHVPTRVLAEIKTYLRKCQADGKTGILDGIQAFTRSFGGQFAGFTPGDYIARVDGAANRSDDDLVRDESFGIAMPPDAVADYAQTMWGYAANVATAGDGNGIIGVTSNDPAKPLYDGLEHYMYRHDGKIYSWGRNFPSVAAATPKGKTWSVCRVITFNWD